MIFSIYETASGRVLRTGSARSAATVALQVQSGAEEVYLWGRLDGETTYIVDGAPMPRPALQVPAALGGPAGMALHVADGLPPGTEARMGDAAAPIVEGRLDITIPHAPARLIITPPWPWRLAVVDVSPDQEPA